MALDEDSIAAINELQEAVEIYSERELRRINTRANLLRRTNLRVDDFVTPITKKIAGRVSDEVAERTS